MNRDGGDGRCKPFLLEVVVMEKLTVEIELSKEELEAFNNFIEQGCIDIKKYLKRLIMKAPEKHKELAEARRPKKIA